MARSFITLLTLTLLIAGCNEAKVLFPVEGSVTLDGQQLSNAIVQFEPIGGGRPATGRLDSSGNYQLITDGENGARVGEYRVSVMPAGFARSEEDTRPVEKSSIPTHYQSPTDSQLSFKVEAKGDNRYDIALKSAGRP